jgi:hypothetical protein
MSARLETPARTGGTTDHSEEIRELRERARTYAQSAPASAIVCRAAADLLEVHDRTGISLDRWDGPRDLVNLALSRHTGSGTFTPNGV